MKILAATLGLFLFLTACTTNTPGLTTSSADSLWHLSTAGNPQILTISAANKIDIFRQYPVESSDGKPAHISCILEAPNRLSFLAVLADAGEIWEMSYDSKADPVFPGFVHNYRTGQVEGITVEEQPFARRRLHLDINHDLLIFSPDHTEVIGYNAEGNLVVYNLDSRKLAGKLTEHGKNSRLDTRFVLIENKLFFVLSTAGGQQRTYSAHNWQEVSDKTLSESTLVTNTACTEQHPT